MSPLPKGCHPERTGPQAFFSLGVVSRRTCICRTIPAKLRGASDLAFEAGETASLAERTLYLPHGQRIGFLAPPPESLRRNLAALPHRPAASRQRLGQ